MATELPFRMFDCDNHYYELDAFTRYIEPEYRRRAVQWATIAGHVEGLTGPAGYIKDLQNFNYTPEQCRAVIRTTACSSPPVAPPEGRESAVQLTRS
jgi:hypothetical protein